MSHHRIDPPLLICKRTLLGTAHQGDTWPVEIAVAKPDLKAKGGESRRKIHSHSRLANATLAACHGNDVPDTRDGLR